MAESNFRVVKPGRGSEPGAVPVENDVVSTTEARRSFDGAPLAARIALAGLARLRDGALTVRLPDGSSHRFGTSETPRAEMSVHRWRFFPRLLRGADVGAGESYVDGDWTTPDLVALTRLFLANEAVLAPPRLVGLMGRMRDRLLHPTRANTRAGAPQHPRPLRPVERFLRLVSRPLDDLFGGAVPSPRHRSRGRTDGQVRAPR